MGPDTVKLQPPHVVTLSHLLEGEDVKETWRIFDLIELIGCEGF